MGGDQRRGRIIVEALQLQKSYEILMADRMPFMSIKLPVFSCETTSGIGFPMAYKRALLVDYRYSTFK